MRPNQVWSIDITYIPIQRSFLYLVALIDWFIRYVIGWEIDDTLDIRFVLEVCRNALAHCKPEIMNSDQGSHFTSPKYLGLFLGAGSRISMDHRGREFDNIFIGVFQNSRAEVDMESRCQTAAVSNFAIYFRS